MWAQSVDPTAPYTPLTLGPGDSGKITLTITPNAQKGTVVRGFIDVDTFNLVSFSGDSSRRSRTRIASAERLARTCALARREGTGPALQHRSAAGTSTG